MTDTVTHESGTQPKKKTRKFFWFFLAIQIVFLIWVILGGHSAQSTQCSGGLNAQDCQTAKDVGTTIGLALIIGLWAVTDIVIGFTYAIYRLATRTKG